jgi:hypothetical protein
MPLSPPVSSTHWNATDQAICANASVSIARYTPDSRTQNQPNTAPASPARNGANSIPAAMGAASHLAASAAP